MRHEHESHAKGSDNIIVLDLGKEVKKNCLQDDMLAWQYNTIGVSDGITMGGEGTLIPHRYLFHSIHGRGSTRQLHSEMVWFTNNSLTVLRHALLPPKPRDNSRFNRNSDVRAAPRRLYCNSRVRQEHAGCCHG